MTVTPQARYPQTYEPAVPVERLQEHPDNPRLGDVEAIGASMEAHGFYGAVYAQRSSGRIVVGNHRYRVAVARGETELPVVWLEVDDETAGRILLVDNPTAMAGGFDEARLADILGHYTGTEVGLVGTGYTIEDLHELLGDTEPEPGYTDPDAIPPTPDETVSRRGDLWLLGPHRLLCGDSTDAGDVQRLMAGERATLMATDPPYLVDYDGMNHPLDNNKKGGWQAYQEHKIDDGLYSDFVAVALQAALAERAPVYQWHAQLRFHVVRDAWEANGLLAHQPIIWVKGRAVLTYSDFMWESEPCLYGWVKGQRPETGRRPPPNESNVWSIDKDDLQKDIHPTEKPVELFARPMRWHTRPGEVCYEPFSGSGSSIIAAHQLGRRCFAVELAPEFVDVACRRFQEHTGVVPVLEATGEPHDFTEPAEEPA